MSQQTLYLTQFSTHPAWFMQLLDGNGEAVDLTLATNATFSMTPRAGGARKVDNQAAVIADGTYKVLNGDDLIVTPVDGWIIYTPVAADVDTAGSFEGQPRVDFPSTAPYISPADGYVQIEIQPAI